MMLPRVVGDGCGRAAPQFPTRLASAQAVGARCNCGPPLRGGAPRPRPGRLRLVIELVGTVSVPPVICRVVSGDADRVDVVVDIGSEKVGEG